MIMSLRRRSPARWCPVLWSAVPATVGLAARV